MKFRLWALFGSFRIGNLLGAALMVAVAFQSSLPSRAAGPVNETAMQSAWSLYGQRNYVASADAFEGLIRSSTPSARLYYYAAVANKAANRISRAKQLCQYITTNFAGTTEADYAAKLIPADAGAASATAGAAAPPLVLPDNLKGKSMEELMQTEEGRKALKDALNQQKAAAASASASSGTGGAKGKSSAPRDQAFTVEAIAKDGADGISQASAGWIESAMAAMASSPRGQKILAGMIRSGADKSYVVRFPGDGIDYIITPQKMEQMEVHDRAMWASVLHCGIYMKFSSVNSTNFEDILTFLTGKHAEKIFASNTTEQARTAFIEGAVKTQSPIVCVSADDFGVFPPLVESSSAYTITGYDASTGMVTLRSPSGGNAKRFSLSNDPEHKAFHQLNDGITKLHITLFARYFTEVARVLL